MENDDITATAVQSRIGWHTGKRMGFGLPNAYLVKFLSKPVENDITAIASNRGLVGILVKNGIWAAKCVFGQASIKTSGKR